MSKGASLTTSTMVSDYSDITASVGNPVSCAQDDGKGNRSSTSFPN